MAQIDLKNATVKFKDGTTPTPNEIEVVIGDGTLSYTETKTREYKLNRGRLRNVRNGDETPVEVSMQFVWEFLTASTGLTPTIEDVLKQRGEASDWVTTGADECEPYSVDIEVLYEPECSDVENEKITLAEFRYETLEHNLKDGVVSVSGKCNILEADIERVA